MDQSGILARGACAITFIMAFSTARAAVVFSDDFSGYTNATQLQASWSNTKTGSGNYTPELRTGGTDSYLSIRNGIVSRSIGTTLTEDWTLSFTCMQGANSRGLWAALMNDAGTQGYLILWDSGGNGVGSFQIRKMDLASGIADWGAAGSGTLLKSANGAASINASDSTPVVGFSLSWDKATGTLKAVQNGTLSASVVDGSFSSFSQIYLRGNGNGGNDISSFDSITVTSNAVPEVASLSLLGVGTMLMLQRRSR